jgi:pre-mRNA-processing factor 17
MHVPTDLDVDLLATDPPSECFLPKRCVHTWMGHTKAVSAIRLFPESGHLLLSASMDSRVKVRLPLHPFFQSHLHPLTTHLSRAVYQ